MPFKGIMAFELALLIDLFLSWTYIIVILVYTLTYVNICTNIWSCIDDLRMMTRRLNANIEQRRLDKFALNEFIELQTNIYE